LKSKNVIDERNGIFSKGSTNRRNPLPPIAPMPGQKGIRLAKKGGIPSLPVAGIRRYQPGHPFPPAPLCGIKERRNWKGLVPALFVFGAWLFARATRRPVRSTNESS
jgi:hypothetical protein